MKSQVKKGDAKGEHKAERKPRKKRAASPAGASRPSRKQRKMVGPSVWEFVTPRNGLILWVLGLLWWLGIYLYPISSVGTRETSLWLVFGLLALLPMLCWQWRWARWSLLGLYAVVFLFWKMPGRFTYDRVILRKEVAQAMRGYEGVPLYREGEGRYGIDPAGLIRRGVIEGSLREGLRTLNSELVRRAYTLWWNDLDEARLGQGARSQAKRLMQLGTLKEANTAVLYPGDFAVVEGRHVLAYLGHDLWIHADPEAGKVVTLDQQTSSNDWLTRPVSIWRWHFLKARRGD